MGMMNRKALKDLKPGARVRPVVNTGPGLTKQEFAKETDINEIMKRYPSGVPVSAVDLQPVFADVSEIGSYDEVLRRIDAARDAFGQLPAKVRSRFTNDPMELIEFLQDVGNRDEAIKLGLIAAPVVVEPVAPVLPVVPPASK